VPSAQRPVEDAEVYGVQHTAYGLQRKAESGKPLSWHCDPSLLSTRHWALGTPPC